MTVCQVLTDADKSFNQQNFPTLTKNIYRLTQLFTHTIKYKHTHTHTHTHKKTHIDIDQALIKFHKYKKWLGSRSNDYECTTLKKSIKKFAYNNIKTMMNQPLMKRNWKLYIESSVPTELANIKDESMAVGPLDSMSQSLSVD